MDTRLLDAVSAGTDARRALYEEFHRTPELSMQETRTVERIEERLRAAGLTPQRVGGTGIVAVLENGEGPVVAYRADIDGLPIAEDTGLEYSSEARGILPDGTETAVMHGCGHDTHITVGLAVAELLAAETDLWSGTVVFLFQPGEEISAGAQAMLDDGLWERVPKPEVVFGQHVWGGRAGTVDISVGTAMAMADAWKVTVRGKQAHGSQPESSIDPIVLGAFMITRLQTVVSREIAGSDMAVVTVGRFAGGLKENIIPDSAEFTVNVRTFDEGVRETVLASIRRIILAEAQASCAPEPEIEELYTFPRCVNDADAAEQVIAALRDELGEDSVTVKGPVTGSEDFGLFGDAIGVPYVYWFFGAYSESKFDGGAVPAGNHSPHFAPDDVDTCLSTGVRAALSALLCRVGR